MDSRPTPHGAPTDRTVHLLELFLAAHPARRETTVAPEVIPQLIGGPKSGRFIIPGDEHLSPEVATHINLSQIVLEPKDLTSFAESFEYLDAAAEARYPALLAIIQKYLAEVRSSGKQVDTIFVPDRVSYSAKDYCRRLVRLAQDTNCEVFLETYDGYETADEAPHYVRCEPPRAVSVEAYWQRYEHLRPFSLHTLPVEPSRQQTIEALRTLGPQPDDWRDRGPLIKAVRTVAASSPLTLRELLLEYPSQAHPDALSMLKDAAYRKKYDDIIRASARQALAKLGNPRNRRVLLEDLRLKKGAYGHEDALMHPLGIYLEADDELRHAFMADLGQLMASDKSDDHKKVVHIAGALHYSFRADAGLLLSSYIDGELPNKGKDYFYAAIGNGVLRWLPMYVAHMRDRDEGAQVVPIAEQRIASLLEANLRLDFSSMPDKKFIWYAGQRDELAAVLTTSANPWQYADLLRAELLDRFKQLGSVLESHQSSSEHGFIRIYRCYRDTFGNLPEIDNLIHLTRSAR